MTPSFTNVLAILPQNLPEELKFLHPYIQSVASPQRHTITYSASNNKQFLAALSRIVLRSCVLKYQYTALISFWASITTEAVATMVDQAQSARREAQEKIREDILLFILPILNDGISIKDALDLRVGCYMILTVLASKASLEESVLTAMMEAVVAHWKGVPYAGLICLATLAQQRRQYKLSPSILKALRLIPSLDDDLTVLQTQYHVDRLVLGIVIGMLSEITKSAGFRELAQMRKLLESGLMREHSFDTAINAILKIVDQPGAVGLDIPDTQGPLTDLVLRLSDSEQVGTRTQNAVRDSKLHLGSLRLRLQSTTEPSQSRTLMHEGMQVKTKEMHNTTENFEIIASRIPTQTAYEISFLSHSDSYIYDTLVEAFCSIHTSNANLERFSELPVLRKSLAMTEPLFISFYIRLWCGSSPATARAAALQTIVSYLEDNTRTNDVQILLPYVIYALSDPSLLVRRAAADLVLALSRTDAHVTKTDESSNSRTLLGHEQIYGQNEQSYGTRWLSAKEATRLVADLLVPILEECLLDDQAICQLLSVAINGPKSGRDSHISALPELKKSLRLSVLSFLCSHIVNSPLYAFKLRMLRIVNQIERVGSTSRTKLLLPLFSVTANVGYDRLLSICQREQIDYLGFLHELAGTVTPSDGEGVQQLRQTAETAGFIALQVAALRRISSIWPQVKEDLQLSLVVALMDLAICGHSGSDDQTLQITAKEALQAVQVSTTALQHLLTHLPTLSSYSKNKPLAKKRKRSSHGQVDTSSDADRQSMDRDVRSITLVLEMVESSKSEQHPTLLQGLFKLLADFKDVQSHSGISMSYLQILAMENMLAIVKKAKHAPDLPIDASAVRIDVLIDYIRTVTDPQVRNTAFLLVAGLADVTPGVVLHSVMPIFTYMGANLLRQEDDFSAHVIRQTMESVIPRLVRSLHNDSKHAFAGVCELLLTFAAAFEHIPQQRRLDFFATLVTKIGPIDYLFALLVILSDRYPGNKRVLDLSSRLSGHQHLTIQLQTLEKYLRVVLDAWNPSSFESPNTLLLDRCHSAKTITINLLPLVIAVFRSEPLILSFTTISLKQTADATAMRASIARIFEQVHQLSQTCRNDCQLDLLCTEVLDSCLDLLPLAELVLILEGLMHRADNDINRKVLQSFEHRLKTQKNHEETARDSCLAFVSRLVSTIYRSTDSILKQAAVCAIEQIVESFGKTNPPKVVEAGRSITADVCLAAKEVNLRVASLLCLARIIDVSGETIVPIIPLVLPKVGINLELSIGEAVEDRSLHNACYSVYQALLLYVPWMITGPNLDSILRLSYGSANAEMGTDCDHTRKGTLQSIARRIEVKELFAALERTWASAVIEGPKAVNDHFEVLRLAIDQQPKFVVKQQSEALGNIFIKAFSLRQVQLCPRTDDSYGNDELEEAEAAINDTAIAMIYKLNDASFRPIFQRIMEWATSGRRDGQSRVYRQTSWYTFLHHFFKTLKSIVTSYARIIIEDVVELLRDVRPNNEDFMRLWRIVIQTLQRTFEHDQDGNLLPGPTTSSIHANRFSKIFTKSHLISHQSRLPCCLNCPTRLRLA